MKPIDVQYDHRGSIVLFRPLTLKANQWIWKYLNERTFKYPWWRASGTYTLDSHIPILSAMRRSRLRLSRA